MPPSSNKGTDSQPDANRSGASDSASVAGSTAEARLTSQRSRLSAGQIVGCLFVGGFLIFLVVLILFCISSLIKENLSVAARFGIIFLILLLILKIIAILIWAVPTLLVPNQETGQKPVD